VDELGKLLEARLEAIVDRVLERRAPSRSERRLLDRKGIARVMGCHPDTIDNWRKLTPPLPCVQIPGSVPRFIPEDCLEWARRQGKTATD
jgi:hypothetical protein